MSKKEFLQEEQQQEQVAVQQNNGSSFWDKMDRFFKVTERGSNWRRELIGGLVTFLAMVYILAVNPSILGAAGMPAGGTFLATALIAGAATIAMGVFAKLPFGLAPGMGTNAFFAFVVVGPQGMGYTWQEALAAGVIAGILFLILSITPARKIIMEAIPANLRLAIGAGIGFFIAFIGLQGAGIVEGNPATLVTLTNFKSPLVLLGLFGITLALILHAMKFRFSIIVSIVATATLGVILGLIWPDAGFPAFGKFDYSGLGEIKTTASGFVEGFKTVWRWDLILVVISLVFLDLFDTMGTFLATAGPAGLIKEDGTIENMERGLLVDSGATVVGNMLGTPVVTTYIESSTGISAGARTGFASVVTGLLFFLAIALFPIFQVFSFSQVTASALVLVGVLMAMQLKNIEWSEIDVAITAFMTIVIMVLTYSITNGIAFGIIFYVITKLASKKWKEIHPVMYALAVAFVAYYVLMAVF